MQEKALILCLAVQDWIIFRDNECNAETTSLHFLESLLHLLLVESLSYDDITTLLLRCLVGGFCVFDWILLSPDNPMFRRPASVATLQYFTVALRINPPPSSLALAAYFGDVAIVEALMKVCKREDLSETVTLEFGTWFMTSEYLRCKGTAAQLALWQGHTTCASIITGSVDASTVCGVPRHATVLAQAMRLHTMSFEYHMCFPVVDPVSLQRGEKLGEGGFGDVYRAAWVHGDGRKRLVAVKVLTLPTLSSEQYEETLGMIATELVVGLRFLKVLAFTVPAGLNEVWIVSNLYGIGTLKGLLQARRLTERQRRQIADSLAIELYRMHGDTLQQDGNLPILHGDIKTDNVLVAKEQRPVKVHEGFVLSFDPSPGPLEDYYVAHLADYGLATIYVTKLSGR